jgi:hypothetical protein
MIKSSVNGNRFILVSESLFEGHRVFNNIDELREDVAEELFNNGTGLEDLKAYEVVREIKISSGVQLS